MTKVSAKYDLRKYFKKILKKKSTFFTLLKFRWSQSPVFVQFIITLLLMNILI